MSDEEKYTEREFSEKFEELRWNLLNAYRPTLESAPQAFLLGGQSGAGKATLRKIIHRRLDGNGISINGDDYRKFHPRFLELQRIYGDEAVNYTAPWAGRMTEALIDSLSRIGYNLVIESTLRTAEVPLKTAELLRQRGYGVSLALMAVKPKISLVSCQIRYEEMRVAGTTPRATDPAHHNKIIDQIVSNLGVLEASGMFDEIALYDRSQTHLFPREGGQKIGNGKNGISLVLPHRHGDPLAVGADHHAMQRQRDGGPLVFFDSAVIVGFEHRKLCFFIKGTGLEVNARRVNMGGDNPHALFERFGPDGAQDDRLAAVIQKYAVARFVFYLGIKRLEPLLPGH